MYHKLNQRCLVVRGGGSISSTVPNNNNSNTSSIITDYYFRYFSVYYNSSTTGATNRNTTSTSCRSRIFWSDITTTTTPRVRPTVIIQKLNIQQRQNQQHYRRTFTSSLPTVITSSSSILDDKYDNDDDGNDNNSPTDFMAPINTDDYDGDNDDEDENDDNNNDNDNNHHNNEYTIIESKEWIYDICDAIRKKHYTRAIQIYDSNHTDTTTQNKNDSNDTLLSNEQQEEEQEQQKVLALQIDIFHKLLHIHNELYDQLNYSIFDTQPPIPSTTTTTTTTGSNTSATVAVHTENDDYNDNIDNFYSSDDSVLSISNNNNIPSDGDSTNNYNIVTTDSDNTDSSFDIDNINNNQLLLEQQLQQQQNKKMITNDKVVRQGYRTLVLLVQQLHTLLEEIEPFFNPKNEFASLVSIHQSMMNNNTNDSMDERNLNKIKTDFMFRTKGYNINDTVNILGNISNNNDDNNSYNNYNIQNQQKQNQKIVLDQELISMCDHVLQSWAQCSKVYFQYEHSFSKNVHPKPQQAQYLLDRMELSYDIASNQQQQHQQPTTNSGVPNRIVIPTIDSYKHVIDAWGYSNEHQHGDHADLVFRKLISRYGDGTITLPSSGSSTTPNTVPSPTPIKRQSYLASSKSTSSNNYKKKIKDVLQSNIQIVQCYRSIIRSWANSKRDQRGAHYATLHLNDMLQKLELGYIDFEPTLDDYKVVLQSWPYARDIKSPGKARGILRTWDRMIREKHTTICPDVECFEYVLICATQREKYHNLTLSVVEESLEQMKKSYIIPNTGCYGACIRIWKNIAFTKDVHYKVRSRAVTTTIELLEEMKVANIQSSYQDVLATTEHYNDVLETLSIGWNSVEMIETGLRLLTEMEENVKNNTGAVPDATSYKHVINLYKRDLTDEKIIRSKEVLLKFADHYEKHMSMTRKRKNEFRDIKSVFNAFISVCANYKAKSDKDAIDVLKDAISCFDIMKTMDDVKPDSSTYAALLYACKRVLPVGIARSTLIEYIFHLCCTARMVNTDVIIQLRTAATSEQFSRIVVSKCELVEGMKLVPEVWTRNSLRTKNVIASDGRTTYPLAIDGSIASLPSTRDFKMTRLRDHRNRNVLQGGRTNMDPNRPDIPYLL